MKPLFEILLFSLFFYSCSNSKNQTHCSSFVLDQTDTFLISLPQNEAGIRPLILPKDIHHGSDFSIHLITAYKHNPSFHVKLAPVQSEVEFNPYDRKREVSRYMRAVTSQIRKASVFHVKHSGSLVFYTLHQEILRHLEHGCSSANIYVLSDLRNTTSDWNSYNKDDVALLYDTDSLSRLFDQHYPIPEIERKDITINLVFQSRNTEEDWMFDKISSLLKMNLEDKGFRVNIVSSLPELPRP